MSFSPAPRAASSASPVCEQVGRCDARTMTVAPGPGWSAVGTSGFNFKDTDATQDGAFKLIPRQGTPNKAKVIFTGQGSNLDWTGTPLPASHLSPKSPFFFVTAFGSSVSQYDRQSPT